MKLLRVLFVYFTNGAIVYFLLFYEIFFNYYFMSILRFVLFYVTSVLFQHFFFNEYFLFIFGEYILILFYFTMTQLVKRAPPYNNFFFIGRSQSRRLCFERLSSSDDTEVDVGWRTFYQLCHTLISCKQRRKD